MRRAWLILLIFLLVVGGVTGWYVWGQYKAATKPTSVVQPKQSTPETGSVVQETTPPTDKTLVLRFYSQYLNTAAQGGDRSAVIAQYGTKNLATEYSSAGGSDPILCGKKVPTSVSMVSESVKGKSPDYADYVVRLNFPSGDTQTASVRLSSASAIDSVTCQ